MRIFKSILITVCMLSANFIYAQAGTQSWMENTMYQSGKINVVVAVVAIILIALFVYLLSIDRKVRKLEEEVKNK